MKAKTYRFLLFHGNPSFFSFTEVSSRKIYLNVVYEEDEFIRPTLKKKKTLII